jgi:hypothetical protein
LAWLPEFGRSIEVNALCDHLEMSGIEAQRVPAEMVRDRALWQWTDEQRVRETVRLPHAALPRDPAVAGGGRNAEPFPTLFRAIGEGGETVAKVHPANALRHMRNI